MGGATTVIRAVVSSANPMMSLTFRVRRSEFAIRFIDRKLYGCPLTAMSETIVAFDE